MIQESPNGLIRPFQLPVAPSNQARRSQAAHYSCQALLNFGTAKLPVLARPEIPTPDPAPKSHVKIKLKPGCSSKKNRKNAVGVLLKMSVVAGGLRLFANVYATRFKRKRFDLATIKKARCTKWKKYQHWTPSKVSWVTIPRQTRKRVFKPELPWTRTCQSQLLDSNSCILQLRRGEKIMPG